MRLKTWLILGMYFCLMGCSNPTNSEPPHPPLSEINTYLFELFRSHGFTGTPQGDWVAFPTQNVKINGAIVKELKLQTNISVQFDVHLEFEPGHTIIESFAGVGETKERAILDAQKNFTLNSFYVFLAAFFGVQDEKVVQNDWVINGQRKLVTIGKVGTRGKFPAQTEQSIAWFNQFEETLKTASALSTGTHWVRLYYAQVGKKAIQCEVLLDNHDWPEMRSKMQATNWPPAEDFYTVRLFQIIQDK